MRRGAGDEDPLLPIHQAQDGTPKSQATGAQWVKRILEMGVTMGGFPVPKVVMLNLNVINMTLPSTNDGLGTKSDISCHLYREFGFFRHVGHILLCRQFTQWSLDDLLK